MSQSKTDWSWLQTFVLIVLFVGCFGTVFQWTWNAWLVEYFRLFTTHLQWQQTLPAMLLLFVIMVIRVATQKASTDNTSQSMLAGMMLAAMAQQKPEEKK